MKLPESISQFFRRRGWRIARFQRETWQAYLDGKSGLVHAPTGCGKSLAAGLGPIIEALQKPKPAEKGPPPLTTLWITPLRALAQDTVQALQAPIEELGLDWTVELRTGDTPSHLRQRQRKRLPTCLVTTPESLALLLSYRDMQQQFTSLRCVVADEWHELLGSKRGVQLELCLARLKSLQPRLRLWGLSATIGNLEQAQAVLLGKGVPGTLIACGQRKRYRIRSLIPPRIDRFPWGGHLGITLLPQVIVALRSAASTLIFANTRSQAEIWHEALRKACPDWKDQIALHHASLSREYRQAVEAGLKSGRLRCVVCTSSLDLGVDFDPVEQVMQVGSPKGLARLIQRAGRSGHQPGATSAVNCLPTHAFELVEICAARRAFEKGELEARRPLELCLDALAQHCVTLALGGGFRPEELYAEVTQTHAFRHLSQEQWRWTLDFIARGGSALRAYPQFQRVIECGGIYRVESRTIAQRHRMSIGTINSDSSMQLRFLKGGYLGTIEEAFIGRLSKGDAFLFNGKLLELVLTRDMTAFVRLAKTQNRVVPRWQGGRIPLSTLLADGVRELLDPKSKLPDSPEMACLQPILAIQRRWSKRKTLIVADTHFGKGAIFRSRGIPVPAGPDEETLRRLEILIDGAEASRLLILGDFAHGQLEGDDSFIQKFNTWQSRRQCLSTQIVVGNHDRVANRSLLPQVAWLDELEEDGLLFRHHPGPSGVRYAIAGHLHPAYRPRWQGRGGSRFPVFWIGPRQTVLPAFGSFTGGKRIRPAPGERLLLASDDIPFDLPLDAP